MAKYRVFAERKETECTIIEADSIKQAKELIIQEINDLRNSNPQPKKSTRRLSKGIDS